MQQEHLGDLFQFIELSKSRGVSDEFLAALLTRRGWPDEEVYAALGSYWEQATGLSIPARATRGESSRDAFLYLLSFSTLATWASALGSMLFRFIELWFPDPVTDVHVDNIRNQVTWQMASIAVAFPIFLLVMRIIIREAQDHPERLQSSVRKWLTYIALLLTAVAMMCDLIWFFDYFLNGELTSRFVLKALTVLLICGVIFAYYLGSLRWDRNTNLVALKARSFRFGLGAATAVIASFCIGLGVAGTPSGQRSIEADNRRVQDLRAIASALHSWHSRAVSNQPEVSRSSKQLPGSVSELIGRGIDASQAVDPETKAAYEYRVRSDSTYELCATFSATSEEDRVHRTQFWYHGKGRSCFVLNASLTPGW